MATERHFLPGGARQKFTDDAAHSYDATARAGERQASSTTGLDHMTVSGEWAATAIDTATDSTTVYDGPCLCAGVYVNTVLSAHTVVLKDSATSKVTLPVSLAAGTMLNFPPFICETSLVLDPDNSSTGNVTVFWRPLDPAVTWAP